ncbi:hypothetical protein E4T39_07871 [Aureobasidium subglaciale]|nr:hypothetical protein E4T39_07871 [Aureobasidium subglaciale]
MPPQQLRHASDNAARDAARRAALRRLDEHIKPHDLSATLEAHRDSNRASIFKKVPTKLSDPDMIRPSYIKTLPYRRIAHLEKKEAPDTSTLAHFKRVVTEAAARRVDDTDALDLQRLEAAAEAGPLLRKLENQRRENEHLHNRRIAFLRKHDERFEEPPPYDVSDRAAFFALIRRTSQLVLAEQRKYSTLNFLEAFASRSLLAYHGSPQPIIPKLKRYAHPEPWCRRPRGKAFTNEHWLDLEVRLFAEWMKPTPSEKAARRKVAGTLIDLIKQETPELVAEPFGSQVTGLTMPSSDVDVRIVDPTFVWRRDSTTPTDRAATHGATAGLTIPERQAIKHATHTKGAVAKKEHMNRYLRKIQTALADHEDFGDIQFQDAHFPLIKAIHKPTGLRVQVVSTGSSRKSQQAIKKYLVEFPHLKALFMVLKTALNLRKMSDPWNGGFGSYTLFMMCVAGLRYGASQRGEGYEGPGRISDNLIHILTFWSKFNTNLHVITLEPTKIYPKRVKPSPEDIEARKTDKSVWARLRLAQPNAYRPYMLKLQDPADPYNNLGRSALAIKDLQKTFQQILLDLVRDLEDPRRKEDTTPLLKRIVGRCDRYFDEMRIPVDLWGEQFVEEMNAAEAEAEQQRAESAVEGGEAEEGAVGEGGAEETTPGESAPGVEESAVKEEATDHEEKDFFPDPLGVDKRS